MMPLQIITSVSRKFPSRAGEWFMSMVLISWGIGMVLQPNMFVVNPFFVEIARFASEREWSVMLLVLGFGRVLMLAINGHWKISPYFRIVLACLSMFVWFWISIGLTHLARPNLGIYTYPWFFVIDLYSVHRASKDAALVSRGFGVQSLRV